MKKKIFLTVFFLLLFLIVTCLTLTDNLTDFDNVIYNFLTNNRSIALDNYFKTMTKLANTISVEIIGCIFLFVLNNTDKLKLISILGIAGLSNKILKVIIKRPRPSHLHLINERGFSFPSGHAMGSMALYGFLLYLVYKKVKNKYLKIMLMIFLSYIIITIGISRIYLGVHYPSDILGGYLLSLAIILGVEVIYNKVKIKEQ